MTWLLKSDNTLISGAYTIRFVRGHLTCFFGEKLLRAGGTTLEAKELCRVHYWRGNAGEGARS